MPSPTPIPPSPLLVDLADLAATESLAARLADRARIGDVIALSGGLGMGKTTFARAFIARRAGGLAAPIEVPSPTFTLVQFYYLPGGPVWHFDLYRLAAPEEAWELGLEEALASAISLIEWPERLGPLLPAHHVAVALAPGPHPGARRARLTLGAGDERWADRARIYAAGPADV